MKYLASIIVTALCLLDVAAFVLEVGTVNAPPAQYIMMVFLIAFTAMVWVAQMRTRKEHATTPQYYRTIREQSVFPIIGFAIQFVFAGLYFAGWNTGMNDVHNWLQLHLPKGVFIPLFIEIVLTAVVIMLWVGNHNANAHTDALQDVQRVQRSQKDVLTEQLGTLQARLDPNDPQAAVTMRLIEEKAESLPLNMQGNAAVAFQQTMQEVIRANQMNVVDSVVLHGIKRSMDRIR